jgi:hypothetical protein
LEVYDFILSETLKTKAMKKQVSVIFIAVLITVTAYSQTSEQVRPLPQFIDYETPTGVITLFVPYPEAPYYGTRGNPYLDRNFKNGYIVVDDSIKITRVPLRYNIFEQRMELLRDSALYAFNYPNRIDTVHFGNKDFIYLLYSQHGVRYYGYFEVLCKSPVTLLKRYTCRLQQGYFNIQMNAGDRSYQFLKFQHYYITDDHALATQMRTGMKSLAGRLSVPVQDLRAFVKENKLRIKHEEDLVKLFEYFGSKI